MAAVAVVRVKEDVAEALHVAEAVLAESSSAGAAGGGGRGARLGGGAALRVQLSILKAQPRPLCAERRHVVALLLALRCHGCVTALPRRWGRKG